MCVDSQILGWAQQRVKWFCLLWFLLWRLILEFKHYFKIKMQHLNVYLQHSGDGDNKLRWDWIFQVSVPICPRLWILSQLSFTLWPLGIGYQRKGQGGAWVNSTPSSVKEKCSSYLTRWKHYLHSYIHWLIVIKWLLGVSEMHHIFIIDFNIANIFNKELKMCIFEYFH